MNRYWDVLIEKVFELNDVKNVVEIGCQKGLNTKNLLMYCSQKKGKLHIIDPIIPSDIELWKQEYGELFSYYPELSLSALSRISEYDAVLIDGDHNWYTVFNELKIIEKHNRESFPIVLLHDISWPYGRRDLYYNPENIPLGYRQAHKKLGIIPDQSTLDEKGINNHLENAIYENNPKNGVLTAVEDFLAETSHKLEFYTFPAYYGLGIIVDQNISEKTRLLMSNVELHNNIIRKMEYDRIQDKMLLDRIIQKTKKISAELNNKNEEIKENSIQIEDLKQKKQLIETELTQAEEVEKMLRQKINELSADLQEKKSEVIHLNEKNMDKESELIMLKKQNEQKRMEISTEKQQIVASLKSAQLAAATHRGSIRYQLGDIIISGLKPSINTIKMPMRIFKLFVRGIRKRKRSAASSLLEMKKSNPSVIQHTEKKIVRMNKTEEDASQIRNKVEAQELKEPKEYPLVSILIVNRDGAVHLKRLFESMIVYNEYPNIEIIIVDNQSTDNSVELIESYQEKFSIKIIKNNRNASFSEANNQAAKLASGHYLLLLNNDVEPMKGWLSELVRCYEDHPLAGTVGSKLIYSLQPAGSINKDHELKVQHIGIAFKKREDFIQPFNIGKDLEPFDSTTMNNRECAAVTAACMLVTKELYLQVGGLDEGYIYGYEDVDFGLKILKEGYKNVCCTSSILFHHEFGTQQKNHRHEVRDRRINNRKLLKSKWHKWLKQALLSDKIHANKILSESPLNIAMIVTEVGENVSAGDYFTAMELGGSLQKLGWNVEYISRRGRHNWYDIDTNFDVVISLLDAYNPSNIKCGNSDLIKIAWMRNWFDRWIDNPGFDQYDILLASSKIASKYVQDRTGKNVNVLSIATNMERYVHGSKNSELECDYCFTGSYWDDPREIIDCLNPENIDYKLGVYGKNWDKIPKFAPYHKGFLPYNKIADLYQSTRIVIDDANRVTKPFGSVNSRVFDAIASGALVITNGVLGAEETFHGLLPIYNNEKELEKNINFYLSNEDARIKKVKELQEIVKQHHTYDVRAKELKLILNSYLQSYKIAIKIAAPKWETVHEWGDYHMALGLKKQFEKKGHQVIIQLLYEWDNGDDLSCDVVILLRGLNAYKPKKQHINIMWNISHPDKVTMEEMNEYDYVFVSSDYWSEHISDLVTVPVESMLQCTDPELFKRSSGKGESCELLFVGNSRKMFRKVIQDIVPTEHNLHVYGTNWGAFIDESYIKGEHIPNKELFEHYGSCAILLNDHWDDMREKGFISNRIFDALSTGAFIISDKVKGIEQVFGDSVVTYETATELKEMVDYYLAHPDERNEKAIKGCKIVREHHTYQNRVERFLEVISKLEGSESK